MSLKFTTQFDVEVYDECEYDSTWEGEIKIRNKPSNRMSGRSINAARDMQRFRHSCRNLDDVNADKSYGGRVPFEDVFYNLEFYTGLRRSKPDNLHIDEFHKEWWGDYCSLEDVHSYIQWVFPIQEQGVNWQAHVLTKEEIRRFRKDEKAKGNLVKSYELMLDFYGIRLLRKDTGELGRAANWEERFDNLNRNTHNNLRITRILKCLGTLGLQHYQAPLVKFFLIETLKNENLPRVKASVLDYFMFAVLDKSDRKELVRFAFSLFQNKSKFVWGPRKILEGATMNAHGISETSGAAVNAHGESETSGAAVNAHGESETSGSAVNAHGESETSGAAGNAHGESETSGAAVNAHGESETSGAAGNAHGESETSGAAGNAHGESETSGAAVNAHEKSETSGAAVNAHGESETSSAAVNAHGESETSGAAVNAHGKGETSSAAVNAHGKGETSSAAVNSHGENETRFAPENDRGKVDEEPNKKQELSGTPYTAEDRVSDNTPKAITDQQKGKKGSQVQGQQSPESVIAAEQSTDENNDSRQVNEHSQFISNGAQGQEKNLDDGEATSIMSQGADYESMSVDDPEEMSTDMEI